MDASALDMIRLMITVSTPVQNRSTKGSIRVKGRAPRMENQIMMRRPTRSLNQPPISEPMAEENRKTNSITCENCKETENFSIR